MRDLQRPHLVHYRDDFMDFKAGAYHMVGDGAINAHVWKFLDKASAKRKDGHGKDAETKIVPFCPNRNSVGETLAALKAITYLNSHYEAPCWLNGRTDLPSNQIIAFPNGLLDLRNNTLHPLDPNFFTIAALGFDYVATAPTPTLWLKFLDEIFAGNDKDEQIATLQEVFGYLLTVDTSQEKAFLLLGPKRSGKGTMLGMLRKLLASSAVAGPSLKNLANTFGLTPLIDKQLAIIDDLRIGTAKDQDILIENVLKITGRGLFTIDRKYKDAWTGTLPVKLLLVSNPMPKLGDDSAALSGRFIIFTTRVSFYGREDPQLLEKLAPELLGVFHWALQGLERLRERGYFVETAASQEARERMANLGSPARAFITERCILDSRVFEDKDDLYSEWCIHARDNNMLPGTKEKFYEALYAAGGGSIQAGRPWITVRDWNGIPIKVNGVVQKKQIKAVMGICLPPSNPFTRHAG
jgi:P4 family phage/plasmid primase-like protien